MNHIDLWHPQESPLATPGSVPIADLSLSSSGHQCPLAYKGSQGDGTIEREAHHSDYLLSRSPFLSLLKSFQKPH
jgi:hypothetical protein